MGLERQDFCPITIVFSFDKALPLAEPLHADAVYDHWRLLLLERLVQLQRGKRGREEMGEEWAAETRGRREDEKGWGGGETGGDGSKKENKWGLKDLQERRWKPNQFSLLLIPIKDSLNTTQHQIHLSWNWHNPFSSGSLLTEANKVHLSQCINDKDFIRLTPLISCRVTSTNTCSLSTGYIDWMIHPIQHIPNDWRLHTGSLTHDELSLTLVFNCLRLKASVSAPDFTDKRLVFKSLTRTNMSSSVLRRFSDFSISTWHVWQTYRWLTAGPPPYLRRRVHISSQGLNYHNRGHDRTYTYVCTCCRGDPTRSAAALSPGHQWTLLCWGERLMGQGNICKREMIVCTDVTENTFVMDPIWKYCHLCFK